MKPLFWLEKGLFKPPFVLGSLETFPEEDRKISHQTIDRLAYFARQAILLPRKKDKAKHGTLKFLLENPARFTTINIDPNWLFES